MEITKDLIMKAVPGANAARAGELADVLRDWAGRFGIDTPLRAAHFLGQVMHESGCLRHMEENLNYTADRLLQVFPKYFNKGNVNCYARNPQKIANRVYANRMGNGSEGSGDGYRYRGRGLIQITGKAQYQAYQDSGFCVGSPVAHPEWLAQRPGAYKSAMWYWWKSGCNALADRDDIAAVTRKINGGTNGLSSRRIYVNTFKRLLCV